MVIYVVYEIDEDKYWQGGNNWTYYVDYAKRFKSIGEAKAAMNGLYRRSSTYNLMYKKMYQD
jgi:hypothetical protein